MTPEAVPEPFRPAGDLPGPGITVIEASAGTGKTHTLTSLVVRYVADGIPLSAILAVTFTKMATGELRDRVRSRLVEAHRGVADALAGTPSAGPPGDDALTLLGQGSRTDIETRMTRRADALADFDSATIATTHGFCQLVLHGLGSAGDVLPGTTLLEDPADLMDEVVDDLYLRRNLLHPSEGAPFTLDQARRAAIEATRNPEAVLLPRAGDDEPGLLRRLAEKARTEVGRRLLEEDLLTYDHLLHRLARTLEDPERGPVACRRLGDRYHVVLVDEFQDTDPVQWTVLRRAFTGGSTRLILIGDPKQAVYAFRGADVHAYLDAAAAADQFFTLDTNWRADQPLLDATAAVLSPLQFGHPHIAFRPVRAPVHRQEAGLTGDGTGAAIRWRLVPDSMRGVQVTTRGLFSKPALREWVALDVAADVARLLDSGLKLEADRAPLREPEPLQKKDVAVLTRTNAQALAVRDALRQEGVPAVVGGLDSIFRSDAATAWLRLLEALQQPSSRSRAAAVALGPFVGMTPSEAATAPERRWESLHEQLHRWALVLAQRGIAALYRAVTVEQDVPGRVLAVEGGERMLTDLGHAAQLLHAEASSGQLGATSLRNWLAARIRAVGDEQSEVEDRSRRLDSDAEAVQVLTIHGAKGLEFAVVYCPYLWDAGPPEKGSPPIVFHDPEAGGERRLDVGCPVAQGPARTRYRDHAALARAERRGEDLRLLYVALTRARHRLVIWWGRTSECRHSPLGRLLLGRDARTGEVRDSRGGEPTYRQVRTALEQMAAGAGGLIAIEEATGRDPARIRPQPADRPQPEELRTASFSRSLDLGWRRASYTSITASAHYSSSPPDPVGSEPEVPGLADEPYWPGGPAGVDAGEPSGGAPISLGAPIAGQPTGTPSAGAPSTLGLDTPSPLAGLPGGTLVGTFVHRVLEEIDFAAADLGAELREAVQRLGPVTGGGGDGLPAGLQAALTTPLGPLLPAVTLADISRADRLDEMSFELPVAGGDRPTGEVRLSDVAARLGVHLPADGPLARYPGRLLDPGLDTGLRGYLTGSLDLVFRHPGPDGEPRWYLADYKSNWLGSPDRILTVGRYARAALDEEMQKRHYPLQALIYSVALHRYLRWRQPGYRPEQHLGGIFYLFLRGMAGPDTPVVGGSPCGVWSWRPPDGLVEDLSDLFDGTVGT